ncbi:hypothetical protein BH24DEI2_BH24DEI2_21760 [soil metagenome]
MLKFTGFELRSFATIGFVGQKTNRYGLSRNIPNDVKREVRKRSGFGCVVCGDAFYTYEHIDPPFSDAKQHDPNCMALLCWGCQGNSAAGRLSKETIKKALTNPRPFQTGFSFGALDIGETHPKVVLGTLRARETINIIRVFGEPILCIDAPEKGGTPFRLSAVLSDYDGNDILIIDENEWRNPTTNWDVEVVGQRIKIRRAARDILLVLRTDPPHKIVIEHLRLFYEGVKLSCKEGQPLRAELPDGMVFETEEAVLVNCKTAIDVLEDGLYIGTDCQSFYGNIMIDNSER